MDVRSIKRLVDNKHITYTKLANRLGKRGIYVTPDHVCRVLLSEKTIIETETLLKTYLGLTKLTQAEILNGEITLEPKG